MTKKEFRNLAVGETFTFEDKKIIVRERKKHLGCNECYFYKNGLFHCREAFGAEKIPECIGKLRNDKTFVIFVEVENE